MKPKIWFSISSLTLLMAMPIQAALAGTGPCSLLNKSEVEALLGGQVSAQQTGPSCRWFSGKQQLTLLNVGVATTSTGGNRALAKSSYPFDGYTQNYYRIAEMIASSETHVYGNGHNGEAMQMPSATPLEVEMSRAYIANQRTQLPSTNAAFPHLMSTCRTEKCARATLTKENGLLVMQLSLDTKVSDEQLASLGQLTESAASRRRH